MTLGLGDMGCGCSITCFFLEARLHRVVVVGYKNDKMEGPIVGVDSIHVAVTLLELLLEMTTMYKETILEDKEQEKG
jgi:hypothetical protein